MLFANDATNTSVVSHATNATRLSAEAVGFPYEMCTSVVFVFRVDFARFVQAR